MTFKVWKLKGDYVVEVGRAQHAVGGNEIVLYRKMDDEKTMWEWVGAWGINAVRVPSMDKDVEAPGKSKEVLEREVEALRTDRFVRDANVALMTPAALDRRIRSEVKAEVRKALSMIQIDLNGTATLKDVE